jgi:tryptophan-rich sensory protein
MALGAVFGVLGTSVGVWALIRIALSDGPYQISDDSLSKAEFLPVALFFLVLFVLACVTAGAAAWAIWRRQDRSRALLTVLLAEFVVGDAAMLVLAQRVSEVGAPELAVSATFFTILVATALWYLFRKQSVVQYYSYIRTGA